LPIGPLYIPDLPGMIINCFKSAKLIPQLDIVYQDRNPSFGPDFVIQSSRNREADDYSTHLLVCFQATQDRNELPFAPLLCRMRGFLKSLNIQVSFSDTVSNFYHSLLDVICQQCTFLEELLLSRLTFISNNCMQLKTNISIKQVLFSHCGLPQGFFPEVSLRLSSLSHLSLWECHHIDSNGKGHRIYHNLVIKMPYTFLDTLEITHWIHNRKRSCGLRIDTSTKSYYYAGNKDGSIIESSEASFQGNWKHETIFSLHIQCRKIKKKKAFFFPFSTVLLEC
jgi:hypothetical protein